MTLTERYPGRQLHVSDNELSAVTYARDWQPVEASLPAGEYDVCGQTDFTGERTVILSREDRQWHVPLSRIDKGIGL